jgi:L-malate glycosyltransferase
LADIPQPGEVEPFGLAVLEAMACKVLSVATRVAGVLERIDDCETGLLYKLGDVLGMANGELSPLCTSARLTSGLASGRSTAQKRFCASLVVPHYAHYQESALAPDFH